MVRTGNRAAALEQLLLQAGYEPSRVGPNAPRLADLTPDLASSVLDTFRKLDGTSDTPNLRPGSWDLTFAGTLVVELDEELHFNRYRALTLGEPWAASLPWCADYARLCRSHEPYCLNAGKWGKRWTNLSCEAMFGPPDNPGQFDAGGAPRWKQRALYDAMKDAAALPEQT